ncbi:hypothetical protein, partial [Pseudoflavonifractor capillosus]|uniref:hypothetical protein n=1 Tax=Pseudoflavonifractor capillosus TaxID=106588 RepID=UPI001957FEA0
AVGRPHLDCIKRSFFFIRNAKAFFELPGTAGGFQYTTKREANLFGGWPLVSFALQFVYADKL